MSSYYLPIDAYGLTLTVSELFSWRQKRFRPSKSYTTTALEATASSSSKNKVISFPGKINLYKSLGSESWTPIAYLESRIKAFENKCCRRMLGISYREHKTNEYAWQQVNVLAGHQEKSTVASDRGSAMSAAMIRHQNHTTETVGAYLDGSRRRGRPHKL